MQVLQALRGYYDSEKEDLRERSTAILDSLRTSTALQFENQTESEDKELLERGWETCIGIVTPNERGNSFPMIPYTQFALGAKQI